jgi:hypothetical protein
MLDFTLLGLYVRDAFDDDLPLDLWDSLLGTMSKSVALCYEKDI